MTDLGYEVAGKPPKPTPVIHGADPTHMGHVEQGQWEQVAETEERLRKQFSGEIDRLERVINTAHRVMAIKNAPGYKEFEQSVVDLRTYAQTEMVGCTEGNDQIRILQGRCQAFSSILSLMRNTEHNIGNLSQQLEVVREKAERAVGPNGKIRPDTIGDMR